jgi:phosphatidylglycerol lysyltransferase
MGPESRLERRRVRWFFAGLLVISAAIDIVGALLIQHQTRSQVLSVLVPESISLGGRTGAVLAGLTLLLLAGGIARGKRVAFRLTMVVLGTTIAFELVKDLDFEVAALFGWIMSGLWWFRHHFDADSDPRRVRWGLAVLVTGVAVAVLYAVTGALLLGGQLQGESGVITALETLLVGLAGSSTGYRALTERASWFLSTLPLVSYGLVILALTQLLRPVIAPRVVAADRERLERMLSVWGRNRISHLAVHGASSYHWLDGDACVAFSLRGRTALALGDPIGPPELVPAAVSDFISYCERQDWIPAFYQVDDAMPYRDLGLTLMPIGAEALIQPFDFRITGKDRADLRYAVHRCERAGVQITFESGPDALSQHADQLHAVSGRWLQSRRSPELGYSLGTLATLSDPDIVVGLAFAANGRLEAFVSWLPVPARKGWTLDLMRRRPDSIYGVMEALILRSIEEAARCGIAEVSLGVAPRTIGAGEAAGTMDRALRAMYWGLDRFQRSNTLRRFKTKFGPRWEDRYLVVPGPASLPEVIVALIRVHLPPLPWTAAWLGSMVKSVVRPEPGRRVLA